MIARVAAFALAGALAGPVAAQAVPEVARAVADLDAAGAALAASAEARDRIAALTEVIAAYDAGLAALRASARALAEEEAAQDAALAQTAERRAAALAALERIERAPAPLRIAHPGGALGAAQAAVLLDGLRQALDAEAARAGEAGRALARLRSSRASALAAWQAGLTGAQAARAEIGTALAQRRDPPRAFVEDPVLEALLMASTASMQDFARALADAAPPALREIRPDGTLPLPVAGEITRHAGPPPRLSVDAAPRALVTAPTTATVLYAGPFPDAGAIVVLEPGADLVLVLSGLGEVFARAGEIVAPGAPLGLMPGAEGGVDADVTPQAALAAPATVRPLYLEVREGQTAADPGAWFALEQQ